MSKELQIKKQEKPSFKAQLSQIKPKWKKGSYLVGRDGRILKIGKITNKEVRLLYHCGSEWSSYGTIEGYELQSNNYADLDASNDEEAFGWVDKYIAKGVSYKDEESEESDSTALTKFDKKYYLTLQKDLQAKRNEVQLMRRALECKRCELYGIVDRFNSQLKKIKKIIWTIELYLGVEEDIMQLQEGQSCTPDVPISFRQRVLYMDEEVAVAEHEDVNYQGIDFEEIERFDEWVVTNKNYDRLIPEPKGVVILRIRRNDKDYQTGSGFFETMINAKNKVTYILIKNGENIYRIWADIIIHPRLFPGKDELQKLADTTVSGERDWDKEKAQDKLFSYRQCLILMQGLIERTPIFQPMLGPINLFKPETYDSNTVNFVYDDCLNLPDGRPPYREWKKGLNIKIQRGTRIYFAGFKWSDIHTDKHERYDSYRFDFWTCEKPPAGVYSAEGIKDKGYFCSSERIKCLWNPEDDVYSKDSWESHARKRRAPFYLDRDDWCVLNYDLVTLEDVEYYIHSRAERENYLDLLPALFRIKHERLKELKWEKGFIKSLKMIHKISDDQESLIWKIIDWYKTKVLWKRPVMEDDAKALRMIESKLRSCINKYATHSARISHIDKLIAKEHERINELNSKGND